MHMYSQKRRANVEEGKTDLEKNDAVQAQLIAPPNPGLFCLRDAELGCPLERTSLTEQPFDHRKGDTGGKADGKSGNPGGTAQPRKESVMRQHMFAAAAAAWAAVAQRVAKGQTVYSRTLAKNGGEGSS